MKSKKTEGYFLFPKRSFRLPLVLRLTRSFFQLTHFQVSKDFQKKKKGGFVVVFLPFIMSAGTSGGAGAPRITT